jgi:hypothetical protein
MSEPEIETIQSDLSFASEAGAEHGYGSVQYAPDGRPYIPVETYTDDGEIESSWWMFVSFVSAPGAERSDAGSER